MSTDSRLRELERRALQGDHLARHSWEGLLIATGQAPPLCLGCLDWQCRCEWYQEGKAARATERALEIGITPGHERGYMIACAVTYDVMYHEVFLDRERLADRGLYPFRRHPAYPQWCVHHGIKCMPCD